MKTIEEIVSYGTWEEIRNNPEAAALWKKIKDSFPAPRYDEKLLPKVNRHLKES